VASGKTDASVVVNDAVNQLKSKADALKKTAAGKNPEAAAAIDAAVAGFEAKAEALKSAVASGKADASLALDETLSGLAAKADELKQLAASGDMDNAVKEMTGERGWDCSSSSRSRQCVSCIQFTCCVRAEWQSTQHCAITARHSTG
jgi:hypothetical protein